MQKAQTRNLRSWRFCWRVKPNSLSTKPQTNERQSREGNQERGRFFSRSSHSRATKPPAAQTTNAKKKCSLMAGVCFDIPPFLLCESPEQAG